MFVCWNTCALDAPYSQEPTSPRPDRMQCHAAVSECADGCLYEDGLELGLVCISAGMGADRSWCGMDDCVDMGV